MDDNKFPPLSTLIYYNDGRRGMDGLEQPPNEDTIPHDIPTEPLPFLDIDKLIEESTGLYKMWWETWKRNHPERCFIRKGEQVIKIPPKPKVTFQGLSHVRAVIITGRLEVINHLCSVRNVTHPIGIGRERRYELA
jgi:hypothetical protein